MVNDSAHNAVLFHLAQLLNKHLLRHGWDSPFKVRETQNPATKKMEEDCEFPATLKQFQRLFYAICCCLPCISGCRLTFG